MPSGNLWINEELFEENVNFIISPVKPTVVTNNFLGGTSETTQVSKEPDRVFFITTLSPVTKQAKFEMEIGGLKTVIYLEKRNGNQFQAHT